VYTTPPPGVWDTILYLLIAQNNYKFEGKERDTKTANDDFGNGRDLDFLIRGKLDHGGSFRP